MYRTHSRKSSRRTMFLRLGLCALVLMVPGLLFAPFFPPAQIDYYSREYGIGIPPKIKMPDVGDAVEYTVIDAEKLFSKGFRDPANGDEMRLTNLGDDRWEIEHVPSGQKKTVKVPSKPAKDEDKKK